MLGPAILSFIERLFLLSFIQRVHYQTFPQYITFSLLTQAPQAKRRHSFDMGQLSRNGCGQLNQEINYYLPPLHFTRNLSTPGVNGGRHTRPFSASNERAKKGFKFWIDDKTKSSSGVKTMGSRGSFLGLGVPRL